MSTLTDSLINRIAEIDELLCNFITNIDAKNIK